MTPFANPDTLDADDRALLQRAADWPAHQAVDELTQSALREIAIREGIDFATALLYDRLLRRNTRSPIAIKTIAGDVSVGVAPGAFYKEYAFTGADGQRVLDIASRIGLNAERIPFASFGSLADNAATLLEWLKRKPDKNIVLVSLSKGGTDIQHALTLPGAERAFRSVSLWINLSGILQGTGLADWLLARPMRSLFVRIFAWWRRYPFEVVHELRRREHADFAPWPSSMHVVHVVGFPLRRHLNHRLAKRGYARLEPWGPNDGGGIVLADVVRWPGTVLPVWGADHYLRQESFDVDGLLARLLSFELPH